MFLDSLTARLASGSTPFTHISRSGSGGMARLALALLESGRNVVLVAADSAELAEYRALLTLFSPERSHSDPLPTRVQWERRFVTVPQHPAGLGGKSGWAERMAALYSLRMRGRVQGVLVTLDNFLLRLPPANIFDQHELILAKGMEMAPELVLEQAVDWGYTRVPMVANAGEAAVRGDILDIFCPGYARPLRLEFFGDTLEEIRHFDPVSQRSIAEVREVRLLPVSPVIVSKSLRQRAEAFWKKEVKAGRLDASDVAALMRTADAGGQGLFSGVYYEDASCLEDWLPPDPVLLLPGRREVPADLEEADGNWSAFLAGEAEVKGLRLPRSLVLRPAAEVEAYFTARKRVYFERLRIGVPEETDNTLALPEKHWQSYQELFPRAEAQERPWQQLVALMRAWSSRAAGGQGRPQGEKREAWREKGKGRRKERAKSEGQEPAAALVASDPGTSAPCSSAPCTSAPCTSSLDTSAPDASAPDASAPDASAPDASAPGLSGPTLAGPTLPGSDCPLPGAEGRLLLSFSSERSRARFLKLAEQDGILPRLRYDPADSGVFALVSPFRRGLYLPWDGTLVLGEDVLQPKVERARKLPRGAFQGLDRYDSLREGDFLVHRDYGIGAFGGLHRMNLGGTENDYLLMFYAGDDRLYLPVDRLSLVQRFKSAEGAQPVPDKLGGSLWAAGKEKARKAIEKIAADLVEMYALRKVVKGFSYGPITEMYREFEASFGFEETPDQARAIEDVLADMDKPEPMDRLVCGDVGFGKTEVALRAAFRAALEGRQAALLCPTTVLAEQHYQTFRSRLAPFPVNVGMLSRFVSKIKQKEVLDATAKGQIDILIGTHRLLSKDVVIPRLGLLILDEEQRFGVRHKERLKEMRKNVDALTLTATPIPRTLQLSLSGIRELSIIETPPPERKPVATALIDRDEATLKGILERELARQGQVFWVYNRVQGLERAAEFVKKLAPDARVGMAHGQMNETALEDAMHKFWHGDLDVLVCTAIIESGLDFPRANTLIVDQAQLFGLGQLYQLRGRVGRSDRQAFAVFVTPDPDRLPEVARQRMRIILDMDYLGAGFQVAMEDLRLRGAGNILGESQSGHMNRLGLDLFLEMLEEAVAKLKGQPVHIRQETELSLGVPAFIPEGYMPDSKERLRYYKLLSSAPDVPAMRDTLLEIRDRFGQIPLELENFAAVLTFKRRLTDWGVQKADIFPDKLRLTFGPDSGLDPARLVAFVTARKAAGQAVRLQPPAVLELPLDLAGGTSGPLTASAAATSPESSGSSSPLDAALREAGRQLAALIEPAPPTVTQEPAAVLVQ